MNRSSKIFFTIFFLLMSISIGLTYYHIIVREDYVVFTDPNEIPDPADFVAYVVSVVTPYLKK